jgi:hypothetical protein
MGQTDSKPEGKDIKFHPADKIRLAEAYGKNSLKNENLQTRKAFENIYDYWQDIEAPSFSDW